MSCMPILYPKGRHLGGTRSHTHTQAHPCTCTCTHTWTCIVSYMNRSLMYDNHSTVWGKNLSMKLTCLSVLSPRSSGTGLGCSCLADDLLRVPIKLASRPLRPIPPPPSAPLILNTSYTQRMLRGSVELSETQGGYS